MVIIFVSYEHFFEAGELYGSQLLYCFSLDRQNPSELAFLRASLYLERNAEILCIQQVVVLWLIQHVLQIGIAL
jgi:hypothetical protein